MTGENRKLIVGGFVVLACMGLGIGDGVVNHAFALRDLILCGVGIALGAVPTLYENVSVKGAGFEANVVSAREAGNAINTATDAATATPTVRGDANPVAQFAVLRVAIERELLALAQLAGITAPRPRRPVGG